MRTHSAAFTAHCVIGHARCKWRGELRAYALVAIRGTDAVSLLGITVAHFCRAKIRSFAVHGCTANDHRSDLL
ncbi:hypothetical protein HMPREF0860_0265 [Treponema socranskii subsp. socranskii VPI DR56BR1116 = ATCC 35536]|uniref:Uncharacterized protein n=1 Tax=Treponema socranskii subsp. socranskii VPI DR56BR1116 = ATCC 35536 TaxID=1125725 RepID=U2L1Q8_TRESO|nr:hypothetical protein HMPREF1325_0024 [Treponema socranskii subsp. socranskii VPI DR56BR1116 = ATCC 35536]ERJ98462.1 hypothetical protein HMPREF0860_0265 [Treponema socranskii subsp. socranskii VPI DR56BR1116 = ATCC 35536]